MTFKNEISEINKVAIGLLLFSTCGEDEETLANACVKQIDSNIFHITYALNDPFDAMDFQVAIVQMRDNLGTTTGFKYTIFKSVYGDDGEFTISIK